MTSGNTGNTKEVSAAATGPASAATRPRNDCGLATCSKRRQGEEPWGIRMVVSLCPEQEQSRKVVIGLDVT